MNFVGIYSESMVVTSTYVTNLKMPILDVSHAYDEDGHLWQFHCGNDDYDMEKMQLVRLDTVLALDPGIAEVGDLPVGFCARRMDVDSPWVRSEE